MTPRYTRRKCDHCGIIKPQPEMNEVTVYREVGQTRPSASGSTFIGALLGHKASTKSLERAIFNTNQRTLRRKHRVWVCDDPACRKSVDAASAEGSGGWLATVLAVIVALPLIALGNSDSDRTTEPAASEARVRAETSESWERPATVQPAPLQDPETDRDSPGFPAEFTEKELAPRSRPAGTCYLKPGTSNVVVTDWDDKMACAARLGLAPAPR
jgi:hypothetical protein